MSLFFFGLQFGFIFHRISSALIQIDFILSSRQFTFHLPILLQNELFHFHSLFLSSNFSRQIDRNELFARYKKSFAKSSELIQLRNQPIKYEIM